MKEKEKEDDKDKEDVKEVEEREKEKHRDRNKDKDSGCVVKHSFPYSPCMTWWVPCCADWSWVLECAFRTFAAAVPPRLHSHTAHLTVIKPCYVMLLHCVVILCYVMLCCVILCYIVLCYVMLCYVTFNYHVFNHIKLDYLHSTEFDYIEYNKIR